MKGLFIKDFALFKNQKKMFVLLLLTFGLLVSRGTVSPVFLMGYIPFMLCIYVMSSISYDEFDNGLAFLMVLPVTRKQYVLEKYLFGICMGVAGGVLAILFSVVLQWKNHGRAEMLAWFPEAVFALCCILFCMVLYVSLMIPIQLKFGSEKGRLVLFGLFAGVAVLGSWMYQSLSVNFRRNLERFADVGKGTGFLILFVVSLLTFLISSQISMHIMEKKEF